MPGTLFLAIRAAVTSSPRFAAGFPETGKNGKTDGTMKDNGEINFGRLRAALRLALLCLCACLWMTPAAEAADAPDPRFISPSQVSLTDWMAEIPGHALITEINIPATHDSGTQHMNWGVSRSLASCQNWSVTEQLEHGIRVLDIRVAGLKNGQDLSVWRNMEITHDIWRCATGSSPTSPVMRLSDVLRSCADFLKQHQKETVVIRLSYDDNKENAKESLARFRKDAGYGGSGTCLFEGIPLLYYLAGDPIPTLDEVRKQIVIIDDGPADKMPDKKDGPDYPYEMEYDKDTPALRAMVFATVWLLPAYVEARRTYLLDVLNIKEKLLKTCLDDGGRAEQKYTGGHGRTPGVWSTEDYRNTAGRYGEPVLKIVGTNINTGGRLYALSPSISEYSTPIGDWLDHYSYKNGRRYGWISMDHPKTSVIRKIIAVNEIRTEKVTVEIDWVSRSVPDPSAFGGKDFTVGGLAYEQEWTDRYCRRAELTMTPDMAQKLENGTVPIGISDTSPLLSRPSPVTYRFEHIGKNHWKCVICPEITVTVHWDLVTPADAGTLCDGFFTALYTVSGTPAELSPSVIRIGESTRDSTVLYLNLPPERSAGDGISVDIGKTGPASAYGYDPAKDRVMKDLLHWEFTLHINAETADYQGSLIFDDNDDRYGLRPVSSSSFWIYGCKLTASDASDETSVLYEVPLTVDRDRCIWSRKGLPLRSESGVDLVWKVSVQSVQGYIITYRSAGNNLDTLLTVLPFTDVEVRWEGEKGDIGKRPPYVSIMLKEKSSGRHIEQKTANAAGGWRVHFIGGAGDDWALEAIPGTSLYTVSGPFLTDDGKGAYFVMTRTGEAAISTDISWYDGMTVSENHPLVKVTLDNGREVLDTRTAGGNRLSIESVSWKGAGPFPVADPDGNPYVYTVSAEMEEAARDNYFVYTQGYNVCIVRKTVVSGQIRWSGSPVRPAWVVGKPGLTLYRRIAGSAGAFEAVDAEPVWSAGGNSFTYSGLPLGAAGRGGTARYEYRVTADPSPVSGISSISTTMSFERQDSRGRDLGTYYAALHAGFVRPETVIPFTVSVEDNGYHPGQVFTVTLKDPEDLTAGSAECAVNRNVKSASFRLCTGIDPAVSGVYTLVMEPVPDGSGWTGDSAVKTVKFTVRLNEETGAVEAIPETDDPVFRVCYTHVFSPVTAGVRLSVSVVNESELSEAPSADFSFLPCLNGEASGTVTISGAGARTLSYRISGPGTYEISASQLPFNSPLWLFDESTGPVTVDVTVNEDGELTAVYPVGTELGFTNIYLGDTQHVSGSVIWDEDYFQYGTALRPETVTLELTRFYTQELLEENGLTKDDIAVLDTRTVEVTDGRLQAFDFGWRDRFDRDGNPVNYKVGERPVPYYTSTECYYGYSVLNLLSVERVHAGGIITWTDEDETFRPGSVVIRLYRRNTDGEAEELDNMTVTPDANGDWGYDFGFYPEKDLSGDRILYFVGEDPVDGYTAKIDEFMVENIKTYYRITGGNGQHCARRSRTGAVFTCDGPLEKFTGLLVDGKTVSPGSYTAVSGSTVLTLKRSRIDRLAAGRHTIRFCYTDGVSDEGAFYVDAVPVTGDRTDLILLLLLPLLSAGLSAVLLRGRRAG